MTGLDQTGPGGAGGELASWAAFSDAAADLAAAVKQRFAANLHHVIGTIRPDGAPRLSGTEVSFDDQHVRVGMMPSSNKLADVRRDPRIEIHSAPLEADLRAGDAKLAGVLVDAEPDRPAPEGAMFRLDLALVSLVRVEHDELVITSWRPGRGVREVRRR